MVHAWEREYTLSFWFHAGVPSTADQIWGLTEAVEEDDCCPASECQITSNRGSSATLSSQQHSFNIQFNFSNLFEGFCCAAFLAAYCRFVPCLRATDQNWTILQKIRLDRQTLSPWFRRQRTSTITSASHRIICQYSCVLSWKVSQICKL